MPHARNLDTDCIITLLRDILIKVRIPDVSTTYRFTQAMWFSHAEMTSMSFQYHAPADIVPARIPTID